MNFMYRRKRMTYIVDAPNKSSVTVTCKIGTFTYQHREIVYNDAVASYFPTLLVKVSDESPLDTPVQVMSVWETPAVDQGIGIITTSSDETFSLTELESEVNTNITADPEAELLVPTDVVLSPADLAKALGNEWSSPEPVVEDGGLDDLEQEIEELEIEELDIDSDDEDETPVPTDTTPVVKKKAGRPAGVKGKPKAKAKKTSK
jgi:hypothetical protein